MEITTKKDAGIMERDDEHDKVVEYLNPKNTGKNLHLLEPNLVLYKQCPKKPKKISGIEIIHRFEIEKIRADIDCFNEDDNAVVIVEVKSKSEKADYSTFGQILYYMADAKLRKCANEKEVKAVRGIILASEIHKSLRQLIEEYENKIPKISLKKYEWTDRRELIITDA